jgi:teichuronic acid biosynthesis glycosyltransferase TuaC
MNAPDAPPVPKHVLRALVVSNMLPDARHPERGRFVRDQVDALRRLPDVEVKLYEFPPGGAALIEAARWLHRHHGGRRRGTERMDVVHAHFGLTAWPALAAGTRVRGLTVHGTDVRHPRTRVATRVVLPLMDLLAAPTPELAHELPARAARHAQVLPCGVDMERFRSIPRASARAELGLDPQAPCLLFGADPARPGKRYDRAQALARALSVARQHPPAGYRSGAAAAQPPGRGTVQLHTLGGVAPERVPLWMNAANAVVVPSEAEGFGLAVLEALACDVPVLATPVGVHQQALEGVAGALCAPFDVARWRAAAAPHLDDPDPRIAGRAHAEPYSATRMAARLANAWRELLERAPCETTNPMGGLPQRGAA